MNDGVHVIQWQASAGSITPGGSFTAPSQGGQTVTITATLDDDAPSVEPPATGAGRWFGAENQVGDDCGGGVSDGGQGGSRDW